MPDVQPLDPERDWLSWRDAITERGRTGIPVIQELPPTKEALKAAQEATTRSAGVGEPTKTIDAASLQLAAVLTAQLSDYSIGGTRVGPFRWDVFLDALNRYPHSLSTVCRWLTPALRNFLGEPRETPEELWSQWWKEEDRVQDLSLHPKSIRFQGKPPVHDLVDYESGPPERLVGRTMLAMWKIRAHLFEVPGQWQLDQGILVDALPRVSVPRLNALVHFVASSIAEPQALKASVQPVTLSVRSFLLREAEIGVHPISMRIRFREALEMLDNALLRGLVKRRPLRLELEDIREYETLLSTIRLAWKRTEQLQAPERMRQRLAAVEELGWQANRPGEGALLSGQELSSYLPGEVAAILMCLRQGHGRHHPQTILAALAETRKLLAPIYPETIRRTKRGRPPKPREFSPTTPDSD